MAATSVWRVMLPEMSASIGNRIHDAGGQSSGSERPNIIRALAGDDTISGLGGDDTIFGGSGADKINGDDGNDQLDGGSGNDFVFGGDGNDSLDGGLGNDSLYGGTRYDRSYGQDGDDSLFTSNGVSILNGEAGADTFTVYANGSGRSIITDFFHGEDHLDFTAYSETSKVPTSFAGLDSNHDGVLNAADRGFSLQDVHLGIDAASSLVFDATRYVGAGGLHLTLFGITELRPSDMVP